MTRIPAGLRLPGAARATPSKGDAALIASAAGHAALLLMAPAAPIVALGVWWNANTVSHYFIHRPFFRTRAANAIFAGFLSALLGFPHAAWRDRHLAHHAGVRPRCRVSAELAAQSGMVLALWAAIATASPRFFFSAYLPGLIAGLGLCAAHGYYEHAHGTTSHYGTLYNLLLFNDGYHVEHHANPVAPWTELPRYHPRRARTSRWPAPLRWLESDGLVALERAALRSRAIQHFLVRSHARAFKKLFARVPLGPSPAILIVGGGLFPRTALVLQRIVPGARVTIADRNGAHLAEARRWPGLEHAAFVAGHFPEDNATTRLQFDVVVLPLSFAGDREAIYASPPAPVLVVHDWLWRRRGESAVISRFLLKRLNVVGR